MYTVHSFYQVHFSASDTQHIISYGLLPNLMELRSSTSDLNPKVKVLSTFTEIYLYIPHVDHRLV